MKNYSKFSKLFFLTIMVLFVACSQDENLTDEIPSEVAYEGKQGYINFETLVENIGSSIAFKTNIVHFDKNKSALVSGRGIDLVDAYIDTNTISLIETDTINYYTLKIINNNPEEKANTFYNLVFEQNLATGK